MTSCACGQPLHYSDPEKQKLVELIVQDKGEYIDVTVGHTTYLVQRHYLALHGLKARELSGLARRGVVNRTENEEE